MATYARRHGGDGGDPPPHGNSSRIPANYESSQPRKVRRRRKNKKILEKFASNNNKPLELDLDPKGGTHKFVGENASLFIKCISNEVARVPFHYPSWDRVLEHDKLGMYRTLHKNELKRHFDAYGGYDNVENAKNHLLETQTQEAWEKIIDELFLNANFMKRSVKNHQTYQNNFTQLLVEMRDTKTSSMLKDWKKMHTKKGGGWVNEIAEDDWERLDEEAARMRKESGTEQIDEEKCLSRVLGDRRGWNRGVGRRLRNIAHDFSYVSHSQS
ncbi:hypothetical protein R6Q57_019798 [Mikania cordata]